MTLGPRRRLLEWSGVEWRAPQKGFFFFFFFFFFSFFFFFF